MSESSYGSTQDELSGVIQTETTTRSTQVDFTPYRYQSQVQGQKTRKLHRHYTTSDLLLNQKGDGLHLRNSRVPLKYRLDTNLSRPDSLNVLPSRCDSGFGTYSARAGAGAGAGRFRSRALFGDSASPPNSLEYIFLKSDYGSSVPSMLSSAMNAPKPNGGALYLSPNYLQYPKFNQSSGDLQASTRGMATPGGASGVSASSCRCSCRCGDAEAPPPAPPPPPATLALTNRTTAEGLSWRRLHMSRAKLKATATTSELLSGFAMVAMVELQINEPTNVPEWLFVMFSVCTTVLVAVHIFALMISTYLLPTIDAISKIGGDVGSAASASSSATDSQAALHVIRESPHERMRGFIELAWAFSTVLGLFLFLVEIAILCWVKFWDYSFAAATAATVIVIPVLIVFVAFAVHFYHSLVVHKCDTSEEDMEQLENMKRNLDSATIKAGSPV